MEDEEGCRPTDLKRLCTVLHLRFPSRRLQQFNLFYFEMNNFQWGAQPQLFSDRGYFPPAWGRQTHEKQTLTPSLNFGTKRHKCHRKSNRPVRMMSVHARPTVTQRSTYTRHKYTHIAHARRKATSLKLPSGEVLVVCLCKFAQLWFFAELLRKVCGAVEMRQQWRNINLSGQLHPFTHRLDSPGFVFKGVRDPPWSGSRSWLGENRWRLWNGLTLKSQICVCPEATDYNPLIFWRCNTCDCVILSPPLWPDAPDTRCQQQLRTWDFKCRLNSLQTSFHAFTYDLLSWCSKSPAETWLTTLLLLFLCHSD